MKSLLVSSFNSPSPHKIDNKEHISQNKSNTFKNNRFFNAFELHGLETVKKAWYTIRARNQNVFGFRMVGHFLAQVILYIKNGWDHVYEFIWFQMFEIGTIQKQTVNVKKVPILNGVRLDSESSDFEPYGILKKSLKLLSSKAVFCSISFMSCYQIIVVHTQTVLYPLLYSRRSSYPK